MNLKCLLPLALLATAPAFAAENAHDMHAHGHGHMAAATTTASADATIKAVNADKGTITAAHGPIPAFNWPPMVMDLKVAGPEVVKGIEPGAKVKLQIEKRSQTDYVVVGITPAQ